MNLKKHLETLLTTAVTGQVDQEIYNKLGLMIFQIIFMET